MEVLFTPWRYSYLTSPKSETNAECIFCTAAKTGNPRETLTLYRSAEALVMLNRYPYTNGHLMVTPYEHRAGLAAMTAPEREEMISLAAACESVLAETYAPHGFNMGLNLGKSAGAGVEGHAHLHVVPRWNGDTNFLSVVGGTRTIPEELGKTRSRLAPGFAGLPKRGGAA